MADISPSIQTIFNEAIEHGSQEKIAAYLDAACGGDESKRQRVEALLRAHCEAGGFFAGDGRTIDGGNRLDNAIQVGTTIGPYKLRERIGEGGMGVVYMADQKTPVRRTVALKIIKPGMDTQDVIARFEAERQALALMNHPNIAKVLEAGATETGRPYFVMELVRGIPITDFCDKQQLDTRARLDLFVTVCRAVQHAHQKGVIHRDLKPSNVLVELHDVTGVPKIIDFGVAKAINQELTERTLHTGFSQMIGTPLYMSPEQAELSGLDVDTRTDVYSLGVLLYELLSGTTPFSRETLKAAGYDEMRRIIREDEPPRPSDRVTTLAAESLSTISANRKSDPRKLGQLLRGELDWIVMKSLEKDRTRRYESASALAADVQHYLDDEPVVARPPSAAYRFRKFARRHRGVLVAISFVAIALVMGTGVSLWQAAEADTARRQAETNYRTARQAVDDMYVRVAEEWLNDGPYLTKLQREFLEKAGKFYETVPVSKGMDADARRQAAHIYLRLANIRCAMDQEEEATLAYCRSIALYDALLADGLASEDDSQLLAMAMTQLAGHYVVCMHSDDLPEASNVALEAGRAVLTSAEPLLGRLIEANPNDADLLGSLAHGYIVRAQMLFHVGQDADGEPLAKRAMALMQRAIEHDPQNKRFKVGLLASMRRYALALLRQQKLEEAEQMFRQAVTIGEALIAEHSQSGMVKRELSDLLSGLAFLRAKQNDWLASIPLWEQAAKLYGELTDQFPGVYQGAGDALINIHFNLTIAYRRPDAEDLEKAIFHARRAVELRRLIEHPSEAYYLAITENVKYYGGRKLIEQPSYSERRKRHLISYLTILGEVLRAAERPVESQQAYNEAVAEQQKFIEAAQMQVDASPNNYGNYVRLHKELSYYEELCGDAGHEEVSQEFKVRAQLVLSGLKPEIEGLDIEGKFFKLSDYRGKVVLLDFFGDWALPCRQMYPLERSLVEEYEGRPFVLLGVCSDSQDVLQKLIEQGDVTWRCWPDGSQDGPIAKAWAVANWPSLFLIDHHGVVRRGFPGAPTDESAVAELKEPIEALVREAEVASSPDSEVAGARSEPP
jgi:serine/threonine protein kinase/peroxiredoxin/tetratricopeptide (TPR) repeat protein